MKIKLPRWAKGDRPRAADLNKLAEVLERVANFAVDGGSGLQYQESATGSILSLIPQGARWSYATVTTECPGYGSSAAGGSNKYGMGAGTLDDETYDPSTRKATRAPGSGTVDIHNGGAESIPAGRRVIVFEKQPRRWHVFVNFCPT